MIKIEKSATFHAAHILADHEQCSNIHGHSYDIDVAVEGVKDEKGMIVDFGKLKQAMMRFDHRFVVQGHVENDKIYGKLPGYDPVPYQPTAENMAVDFADQIAKISENIRTVSVTLWETATSSASYTKYCTERWEKAETSVSGALE